MERLEWPRSWRLVERLVETLVINQLAALNHLEADARAWWGRRASSEWPPSAMTVRPGRARESARGIDEASARAYGQVRGYLRDRGRPRACRDFKMPGGRLEAILHWQGRRVEWLEAEDLLFAAWAAQKQLTTMFHHGSHHFAIAILIG